MHMVTVPTQYVSFLQKLASDEGLTFDTDNQEKALGNVKANKKDSRKQVGDLFSHAKSVEKQQSKDVKKALPGKKEKETGGILLKSAAVIETFRENLIEVEKTAGAIGVMYAALVDELTKIASQVPTSIPQVNHELGGFKSLAHSPVRPGQSMASGVGAALKKLPRAAAAVR